MPYRKRSARRRREEYSEAHVFQLTFGHAFEFLGDTFGEGANFDEEAARAAWDLLRLQILREYVVEHPCRRPAAWWWFDAPELRRRVDGGKHPCEAGGRDMRIFRGVPAFYTSGDDRWAEYESEPAYLARLRLLTVRELRHLQAHPELLKPEPRQAFLQAASVAR